LRHVIKDTVWQVEQREKGQLCQVIKDTRWQWKTD
jgi:hypothetical protein